DEIGRDAIVEPERDVADRAAEFHPIALVAVVDTARRGPSAPPWPHGRVGKTASKASLLAQPAQNGIGDQIKARRIFRSEQARQLPMQLRIVDGRWRSRRR